jgi:ATP-dependent Lhr-like helicase
MDKELALLASQLQDWIRLQKWKRFQPIQREAIRAILQDGQDENDFILSSMTASGKTEAAFLPALTKIHTRNEKGPSSFEILYISPLKALINDMSGRIKGMGACVHRQTYRRHGDVTGKERSGSSGILLTTPESLEAQFIRSPDNLAFAFGGLQVVIIDEIHAYFESPRGPQLISLLTRLEALLAEAHNKKDSHIQRIGLSATINARDSEGQEYLKFFLRPDEPERVKILCPEMEGDVPIRIHLKVFRDLKEGYISTPRDAHVQQTLLREPGDINLPDLPAAINQITHSLFEVFSKCHKGLIFTNSRREAEDIAELLNQRAREKGLVSVPKNLEEEYSSKTRLFWPHHGSLDSSIRSLAEKTMRDQERQSILVCTTTLELGIDIGLVEATAQIGSGYSVASLRQRLGRSGRREGMVPTLHAYVRESDLGEDAHVLDRLHLQTFRTLAQIHLLGQGAFEPPDLQRLNLSTLIQQLLSCIHQYQDVDGLNPEIARVLLVERGPFRGAVQPFMPLIDHLSNKHKPLIEKHNGNLFLTETGIKVAEHFTFFAAFHTPEEYMVRAGGRRIGAFATRYPYGPGDQFLFAGTFWEVLLVDHARHVMEVRRTSSGRAPNFQGDALAPSDLVVQQMYQLYRSAAAPVLPQFSNETARDTVKQGRSAFRKLFQDHAHIVQHGNDVMLFPWVGTRKQITLVSLLKWMGFTASTMDVSILVSDCSPVDFLAELGRFEKDPLPGEYDLARFGSKLTFEKHDHFLSPLLKRMNFASAKFDVSSLPSMIKRLQTVKPEASIQN